MVQSVSRQRVQGIDHCSRNDQVPNTKCQGISQERRHAAFHFGARVADPRSVVPIDKPLRMNDQSVKIIRKPNKMKPLLFLSFALFTGVSPFAADASPKDEITAAAKKLDSQSNYSWKATVVVPESAQFKPGPTEGKTEKDGFTYVEISFGDNVTEGVKKGDKAVVTDADGNWKTASELENEEGFGRFLGAMAKNIKTPATQALELIPLSKEWKKAGDLYSAELTPEGTKKQFRFGEPKDPKGSVKLWVKDGMLTKMEVKVEGKMEFNGNEFDASRTTTTEIKNVGTTKVTVPEGAKKKLS
jgi:hypothetical protein